MLEKELAILTVDVPEHQLKAGDIGTIVKLHQGDKGYDVEFRALNGTKIAKVSLSTAQVRPAEGNEIAHVRVVGGMVEG